MTLRVSTAVLCDEIIHLLMQIVNYTHCMSCSWCHRKLCLHLCNNVV